MPVNKLDEGKRIDLNTHWVPLQLLNFIQWGKKLHNKKLHNNKETLSHLKFPNRYPKL